MVQVMSIEQFCFFDSNYSFSISDALNLGMSETVTLKDALGNVEVRDLAPCFILKNCICFQLLEDLILPDDQPSIEARPLPLLCRSLVLFMRISGNC